MTSYEEMVVALRQSHERLVAVVEPLQDMDVEQPAYPARWSIADALSHLGWRRDNCSDSGPSSCRGCGACSGGLRGDLG